jgi:hypothetical protein
MSGAVDFCDQPCVTCHAGSGVTEWLAPNLRAVAV